MKIFHFLTIVIIFVLTIFLVLVIAGPKKGCSDPVKKCSSGYIPVCHDGEWKCVKDILNNMCRKDTKPTCDLNIDPVCINGEWKCNYYKVDPDLDSKEQCYPMSFSSTGTTAASIADAESICDGLGKDCVYFTFKSDGSMSYTPLGDEDNSKVSGFRVAPFSEGIFNRHHGYDMTDIFSITGNDIWENDNVSTIKQCENLCVNTAACQGSSTHNCTCTEGCFGYVYDKDNGTCTVYTTNSGAGVSKYVKGSN